MRAGNGADPRGSQYTERQGVGSPYPGSAFSSSDLGFFLADTGEEPGRLLSTRWCCGGKALLAGGGCPQTGPGSWEGPFKGKRTGIPAR